jgi:Ca-activated chloride channel family protein
MSKHNGDDKRLNIEPELITAYALGQLEGEQLAAVQEALTAGGQAGTAEVREIQAIAGALSAARGAEALLEPSAELRLRIEQRLLETAAKEPKPEPVVLAERRKPWWQRSVVRWAIVGCACCLILAVVLPAFQSARESARRMSNVNKLHQIAPDTVVSSAQVPSYEKISGTTNQWMHQQSNEITHFETSVAPGNSVPASSLPPVVDRQGGGQVVTTAPGEPREQFAPMDAPPVTARGTTGSTSGSYPEQTEAGSQPFVRTEIPTVVPGSARVASGSSARAGQGRGSSGPPGRVATVPKMFADGSQVVTTEGVPMTPLSTLDLNAKGTPPVAYEPVPADKWEELAKGRQKYKAVDLANGSAPTATPAQQLAEVSEGEVRKKEEFGQFTINERNFDVNNPPKTWDEWKALARKAPGTEQYEPIVENAFLAPLTQPLSTFSIDVDTASYANMRRFLTSGRLPPANSVRIEELVNYFRYDYSQPKGSDPFSVNMEVAECPWTSGHLLMRVGLKGREVRRDKRPPSNLVFLLDVSGSMSDANKLPLLKTAMQMLVRELGENDRVSIVTYAGEAGLKLSPTRGHDQERIIAAIESLSAGGSTNGSAGINLAYEQAAAYFVEGGTNRVILCTDGDLNVGITSDDALVRLIKKKASSGTFLTVLGFGEGNLKDAKMEKLADNGNGLYAYIDSIREARKVLVEQLTGSTITIAKDVKIQIEFNPAQIASYRLLGYENRVMAAEDFNNDKKDAGDIGAGHTVTALYELVPVGAVSEGQPRKGTEELRYQKSEVRGQKSEEGRGQTAGKLTEVAASGELLTLKLRYKEPEGQTSKLLEYPLKARGGSFNAASRDFQFAAAVASYGMILRGSEHRGTGNLAAVAEIAAGALGDDPGSYRAEFLDLVRKAQALGGR